MTVTAQCRELMAATSARPQRSRHRRVVQVLVDLPAMLLVLVRLGLLWGRGLHWSGNRAAGLPPPGSHTRRGGARAGGVTGAQSHSTEDRDEVPQDRRCCGKAGSQSEDTEALRAPPTHPAMPSDPSELDPLRNGLRTTPSGNLGEAIKNSRLWPHCTQAAPAVASQGHWELNKEALRHSQPVSQSGPRTVRQSSHDSSALP